MWRKYLSVRNRQPRNSARFIQCETLETRQLLTVVISEFMADNDTGIVDSYGNHSDWIELRNSGNEARDVSGWYLTDDPTNLQKWSFPNQDLSAGNFLIAFASPISYHIPDFPSSLRNLPGGCIDRMSLTMAAAMCAFSSFLVLGARYSFSRD